MADKYWAQRISATKKRLLEELQDNIHGIDESMLLEYTPYGRLTAKYCFAYVSVTPLREVMATH